MATVGASAKTIASSMLMVYSKFGQLGVVSKDSRATREYNVANGTEGAIVSATLSTHPALKKIGSNVGQMRIANIAMTHPCTQESMRLLRRGKELAHADTVNYHKNKHDALVDEFMLAYDDEAASAPARLGPLYNPNKWPTNSVARSKFYFSVRYLPCPSDGEWAQILEESAIVAASVIRDKMRTTVEHVITRLTDGERLHASVFDNVGELLRNLADLNFGEVVELDRLADLIRPLASYDASLIKHSPATRRQIADQASSILDQFGAGSL